MENAEKRQRPDRPSLRGVLLDASRRLTSQPLIYGLAVLLVLTIITSAAVERANALLVPAITIFALGVLAWLAAEYMRQRERINISAERLGKGAEVVGATGASTAEGIGVKLKAKDIGDRARVIGIEFAQQPPVSKPVSRADDAHP